MQNYALNDYSTIVTGKYRVEKLVLEHFRFSSEYTHLNELIERSKPRKALAFSWNCGGDIEYNIEPILISQY